ncbi:MAG: MoaD/ThiS family protein, partial [Caldilineae bacterium]
MEIKVYATLRAIVGGKSIHLDHDGDITVKEMVERLFGRYPALKGELLTRNG